MLKLYNTLTRQVEQLRPISPDMVKIYTCGPTVYRDAHIGNLRSYLMADWLRRVLEVQGLAVVQVKNITDVGHMRQELLEQGEDKVVAAALAAGRTPSEIAQLYTQRFFRDEDRLNIIPATYFPRATEYVGTMVEIIKGLAENGFAYEVQGNVYFDVSKFPRYGQLSGNLQDARLLTGVRVEADPLKRGLRDFTLWKVAEPGRELKWPSPWGEGFPGWHIECSAMSISLLGSQFDIHTGGVDNIFPHHEGEIAQSEGYTGHRVVSLWLHGQHLLADGVKMAKSAGNSYILADLEARGIEPAAFRYLCLTSRYSTRLDFTFRAAKAAQQAWHRLRNRAWEWSMLPHLSKADGELMETWQARFLEQVNNNLDMPRALALTWELVRSELSGQLKLQILLDFDRVLGLRLDDVAEAYRVPDEIYKLVARRSRLRQQGRFREADSLRAVIGQQGYLVEDTPKGTRVRPRMAWEVGREKWPTVSSSAEVPSLAQEADGADVTVGVVACNYVEDVSRCIQSILRWTGSRRVEVLVVNNYSTDGTGEWLQETGAADPRVRLIHTDHVLGDGAAKNIVLKQARGKTIILMDASVEVMGDTFTPIDKLLDDDTVGVVGPFGLWTEDLRHFREERDGPGSGDADVMQAYCFAFRRARLKDVGFMRESFRFYRNLDLDYSFYFKDRGYRIVAQPALPVRRHVHRAWEALSQAEREAQSARNFRRFLRRWDGRQDLLVANSRR